jgi:hypothetical protein
MSDDENAVAVGEMLQRISDLLDMMGTMSPYRGELSPKQVADGMNAASRNAIRLLKDAEILFEAKRYPSASSLAALAIEEVGKSPILRSLAVAKDADAIRMESVSESSKEKRVVAFPALCARRRPDAFGVRIAIRPS